MGPKYQIVRRTPIELLVASWMSPFDQAVFAPVTCHSNEAPALKEELPGKPGTWESKMKVFQMTSLPREPGGPKQLWFMARIDATSGHKMAAGCIRTDNGSWLSCFDFSQASQDLDVDWGQFSGEEARQALQAGMEVARALTGNAALGAEIALVVIEKLAVGYVSPELHRVYLQNLPHHKPL